MNTLTQIHQTHINLLSEINFSLTELRFLLKLVNKEYSICLNNAKVKILDSYYVLFEKQVIKLMKLKEEVNKEDLDLKSLFTTSPSNSYDPSTEGDEDDYSRISNEIRIVKESFYDYILNNK